MPAIRWWASLVLVLLLLAPVGAEPPKLGNAHCPVMTDKAADPEFSLVYKGRRIYFCCDTCVEEFRVNPAPYLGELDNVGFTEDEAAGADLSRVPWIEAGLFLLGLIALVVVRRRRLASEAALPEGAEPPKRVPLSHLVIMLLIALLLGLGAITWELYRISRENMLEEWLQFATYQDFGDPPIPQKPPVGPRLEATFFRGNDERSNQLFNGGNYRTCTFEVRLTEPDGTPLRVGAPLEGKTLCVELVIKRAPHTPDFFFSKGRMDRVYATRKTERFLGRFEPVADRVALKTVKPLWEWRLRYPIGALPKRDWLKGIVYVCEEMTLDGELIGGRLHYALQYDLRFEDGVLTTASDLWMGALRRSSKVRQWRIPAQQWFSHAPIPELEEASQASDELQGISTGGD